MAAIFRSRQTFLPDVIPDVEYTSKIAMSISDILSFWSTLKLDGDISIWKFDLLCDLVTSSMTPWIRVYINVIVISWYLRTGGLIMISLLVFYIKFLFHFQRNIEGRILSPPVTSSVTSSSWKILFMAQSFHIWGRIEAVFNISRFSIWPPCWARDFFSGSDTGSWIY